MTYDPAFDQSSIDSINYEIINSTPLQCCIVAQPDLTWHYYNPITGKGGTQVQTIGYVHLYSFSTLFYNSWVAGSFKIYLNQNYWSQPCTGTPSYQVYPQVCPPGCRTCVNATTCSECLPATKQAIYTQYFTFDRSYGICEAQFVYTSDFTVGPIDTSNQIVLTAKSMQVYPEHLNATYPTQLKTCFSILQLNFAGAQVYNLVTSTLQNMVCVGTYQNVSWSYYSGQYVSVPTISFTITSVSDSILNAYILGTLKFSLNANTVWQDASKNQSISHVFESNTKKYPQNCLVTSSTRSVACALCNPVSTAVGSYCECTPIVTWSVSTVPAAVSDTLNMTIIFKNGVYVDEILNNYQGICANFFNPYFVSSSVDMSSWVPSQGYDYASYVSDIIKMACFIQTVQLNETYYNPLTWQPSNFTYDASIITISGMPKVMYIAFTSRLLGFWLTVKSNDFQFIKNMCIGGINPYQNPGTNIVAAMPVYYQRYCTPGCSQCLNEVDSSCSICNGLSQYSSGSCNCISGLQFKVQNLDDTSDCSGYEFHCLQFSFYNVKFQNSASTAITDCTQFFQVSAIITPSLLFYSHFISDVLLLSCSANSTEQFIYKYDSTQLTYTWSKVPVVNIIMHNVHDELLSGFNNTYFSLDLKSNLFSQDCSNPLWNIGITAFNITIGICPIGCTTCSDPQTCTLCNPYTSNINGACMCTFYHEIPQFTTSGGTLIVSHIGLLNNTLISPQAEVYCPELLLFEISSSLDPTVQSILTTNIASLVCNLLITSGDQSQLDPNIKDQRIITVMTSTIYLTGISQSIVDHFLDETLIIKLNDQTFVQNCQGSFDYTLKAQSCSEGCDVCMNSQMCKICNPFTKQGINSIIPTFFESQCQCETNNQVQISYSPSLSTDNSIEIKSYGVILTGSGPYTCSDLFSFQSSDSAATAQIPNIVCAASSYPYSSPSMIKTMVYLDILLTTVHDSILQAFQAQTFSLALNTANFNQDCASDGTIARPTDQYTSQTCLVPDSTRPTMCSVCNPNSNYDNGRCRCRSEFNYTITDPITGLISETMNITIIAKNLFIKKQVTDHLRDYCAYISYYLINATYNFNAFVTASLTTPDYTLAMFQADEKQRSCEFTQATSTNSSYIWDTGAISDFQYKYTKIKIYGVSILRIAAIKSKQMGLTIGGKNYDLSLLDYQCDVGYSSLAGSVTTYNLLPSYTCGAGCEQCSTLTTCAQCNPASYLSGGQCNCNQLYQRIGNCSSDDSMNCITYQFTNLNLNTTALGCLAYLSVNLYDNMTAGLKPLYNEELKNMRCVVTSKPTYIYMTNETSGIKEWYFTNQTSIQITSMHRDIWTSMYYQYTYFALNITSFYQNCLNPSWDLRTYALESNTGSCLQYGDPGTNLLCVQCAAGFITYNIGAMQIICIKGSSQESTAGPAAPTDPCLVYTTTAREHCSVCKTGYKPLMFNSSKTICGVKETFNPYCTLDTTYYDWIPSLPYPYERITFPYTNNPANAADGEYCFNCIAYYIINNETTNEYKYSCWDCAIPLTLNFIQQVIYSKSVGCSQCDPLYNDVQLANITSAKKFIRNCGQKQSAKDSCQMDEFSDNGVCTKCSNYFPNCAACNKDKCLFCPVGYFPQLVYDYKTGKQIQSCIFGACPPGYGKDDDSLQCKNCGVDHCFQCGGGDFINSCEYCEKDYYLQDNSKSGDPSFCIKMTDTVTLQYFIRSGAPYKVNSTFVSADYISPAIDGSVPAKGFYFLKQAIQRVYAASFTTKEVNVTIYFSKGDHFFYHCDKTIDISIPQQDANLIWNNCADLYINDTLSVYATYQGTDNINYKFKALQCNMGTSLGLATDGDFFDQCVDLTQTPKPKIFINQNTAYFNITATASFENLIFSGINSLIVSTRPAFAFQNVIPLQMCNMTSDITGSDGSLNVSTIIYPEFFNFTYNCSDIQYTGSYLPTNVSTNRCNSNSGKWFTPTQQSTLKCPGEPNHSQFFSKNANGTYNLRRHTLFNLYAYGDYYANYQQPPTLNLTNCDFEYFLADYESLINVESNNLGQILYTAGTSKYIVYTYSGGEKGARIRITNSNFKNSRFCKGLLVYRKQNYIKETLSFTNYTQLYMIDTKINDKGSFIILQGCSFQNLNIYRNVTALAIYGGIPTYAALTDPLQIQTIYYQTFINQGIVLNIADFGGQIEIIGNTFNRNMHFIPEILMSKRSTTDVTNFDQFSDQLITSEVKMAICDESQQDQYFFQKAFADGDDLDNFFDTFERLGLIMISRNRGQTVIQNNYFNDNIGTFGGAITINSPDWLTGNMPYVVIANNNFRNNMAYFSGNAIYIRNTKRSTRQDEVCAGIFLQLNTFINNIGMKNHNGGAVSGYCQLLKSISHEDYLHTSTYTSLLLTLDLYLYGGLQEPVTSIVDGTEFQVYKFKFAIVNSIFQENYSGRKGTAVYARQMSAYFISQCTFTSNGPVFTIMEQIASPYVKYLSSRFLTYYNGNDNCQDEFQFLENCGQQNVFIDWPHVYGAVYIQHCEELICMTENNMQIFIISDCQFYDNSAGPVMDKLFPQGLASSLYIAGGFTNQITRVKFYQTMAKYDYGIPTNSPTIKNYMPSSYYTYSQAPAVSIQINPAIPVDPLAYLTTIDKCIFQGNQNIQAIGLTSDQMYYGSLIQYQTIYGPRNSKIIPQLKITNSQFTDNFVIGPEASLIYVFNGILTMQTSTFLNNGYLSTKTLSKYKENLNSETAKSFYDFETYDFDYKQNYGMIGLVVDIAMPQGYKHAIQHNKFSFSFASLGSVFVMIVDGQYVYLSGNQYNYNFANKGSVLYAQSSLARSTIQFEEESISNQYSTDSGAITINPQQSDLLNLIINRSNFNNNYAQNGASICMINGGKVMVDTSTFTCDSLSRKSSSFVSSQFKNQNYDLSTYIELPLFNSIVDQTYVVQSQIYIESSMNTASVMFQTNTVQDASNAYIQYSEFKDCTYTNINSTQASAFTIYESKVRIYNQDQKNKFSNNQQVGYGVIQVQRNGYLICDNLQIENNKATDSISAMYFSASTAILANINFIKNSAVNSALIMIERDSSFQCSHCLFANNYAQDTSTILASKSDLSYINIQDSIFLNNTSKSNLVNLLYSKAIFGSTQFIDNLSTTINNGITMVGSQVIATNITVNYTDSSFLNNNNYTVDAGFFNLNYQSSIQITGNSRITNCRGGIAAILYATGSSSVLIDGNTSFTNSMSASGNALFFTMTDTVQIYNSRFINNSRTDIYLNKANATIVSSNFTLSNQQAIYAVASSLNLIQSTFSDSGNTNINGKGLYCDCIELNIQNCTFKNLSSVEGGAVYLTSSNDKSNFTIAYSKFIQNQAQQGGAIKIQDAASLRLIGNTFIENSALLVSPVTSASSTLLVKALGGAIYFACKNEGAKLDLNCNVTLSKFNNFTRNYAQHDGGAIAWVQNKFMEDNTTFYDSNIAVYGNNIASYPKELKLDFLNNNDYANPYNSSNTTNSTRRRLEESFPEISSGTPVDFLFYIIDQDGQVYSSDNSSSAALKQVDKTSKVVLGNNEVPSSMGVFNFRNVEVNMFPGSNTTFELEVSGLNTFGNNINFLENLPVFMVKVRKCISGEQMTSDFKCQKCPEGKYLYDPPENVTTCKECQKNQICYGGKSAAPAASFWRSSASSESYNECPRPQSCLAGNEANPTGICAEGYHGVLCGECNAGHSKAGSFECKKCPERKRNIVQLTFILLLYIGQTTFLVRSTLNSNSKMQPVHSIYIKILNNHFQIIGAIMGINYQFPSQIAKFTDGQGKVSEMSSSIFSFDCFIMDDEDNAGERVYYIKLIIYALLPLILSLAAFTFWFIYSGIKKTRQHLRHYLISTIVILLFMVHSDITKKMFASFNCYSVDGVLRLRDNLDTICYKGTHLTIMLIVTLPSLIIWVIGIPLFALILLFSNKKKILLLEAQDARDQAEEDKQSAMQIRQRYGFLFGGYKIDRFFWEAIITYRKIVIVMVAVFLSVVSPEVQVLVALCIIIFNIFLQIRYQPYYTTILNFMEIYSLLVASITMYAGLFYITGAHYNYMNNDGLKWFFLICIILPNVFFLLYWSYYMRLEALKIIWTKKNPKLFRMASCCQYSYEDFGEKNMEEFLRVQKYNEEPETNKASQKGDQANVGFTQKLAAFFKKKNSKQADDADGNPDISPPFQFKDDPSVIAPEQIEVKFKKEQLYMNGRESIYSKKGKSRYAEEDELQATIRSAKRNKRKSCYIENSSQTNSEKNRVFKVHPESSLPEHESQKTKSIDSSDNVNRGTLDVSRINVNPNIPQNMLSPTNPRRDKKKRNQARRFNGDDEDSPRVDTLSYLSDQVMFELVTPKLESREEDELFVSKSFGENNNEDAGVQALQNAKKKDNKKSRYL